MTQPPRPPKSVDIKWRAALAPQKLSARSQYMGREPQIDQLTSLFSNLPSGRGSHFLLVAPRGSGKSSLLKILRDSAIESNVICLYTSISEETTATLFIAQIIRQLRRLVEIETLEGTVKKHVEEGLSR